MFIGNEKTQSLYVDKEQPCVCGDTTYVMLMKNSGGLSIYGSSIEGVEIRNRKRRLEW